MKNYYDTKAELEVKKLRLKVLYRRKESLKSLVEPKSVVTDKIAVDGGDKSPDEAFVSYTHAKLPIDEEIKQLADECKYLESELAIMEKAMRQMSDIRYRIFVMRYLDGMSAVQISTKLHYSREHVHYILRKIDSNLSKKILQNLTKPVI